jgi:hypothetical protein
MPSFKLDYYSFRIKKKNKDIYVDVESAVGDIAFAKFFKKFASLFETDIELNEIFKKTFQFEANTLKFSSSNRLY